MKLFYSTIAITILLASCGTTNSVTSNHFLQKRKYTNGWHFNNLQREVSSNNEAIKENNTTDASLNSTIYSEKSNTKLIDLGSLAQAECDTIILNDGKIVRAKILSTSDSTIQYTKCESDDPMEFTMDKKEIKALQYANGKFEFIIHQSAKEANKHELDQLTKEKKWQARQNTTMSKKEIKEKLKPRFIFLKAVLTILFFLSFYLFAVLSWGEGILAVIAICCLILAFCFLIAFIISLIKRDIEKTQLLSEKAKIK